jgi:phosphinothricin acetyltransferase
LSALVIRSATADDSASALAIYAPIVKDTVISFETEPPSVDEFSARIEACLSSHAWLVAESDGALAGYAYGTAHRARHAYRFSTEVSVYVHAAHRGRGVGRVLYERLFERLAELGYYHAFAGITVPNDGSISLHRAVGFHHVGTFPQVGFKFGGWHDVSWWHRPLRAGTPEDH